MRSGAHLVLALLVAAPTGCANDLSSAQPAIIAEPSAAGLTELQTKIAALVGGRVTLTADAFTITSELVIERSPAAMRAQGRVLGPPERFLLRKQGSACFLVRERDGKQARLTVNRCVSATEQAPH